MSTPPSSHAPSNLAVIDRQVAIEAEELPGESELVDWVSRVLAHHPEESRHEVTVRLVEVSESQALNRDYRGKDKPTNVLSFPFDAPPEVPLPLLGDLVICHAIVVAEAQHQAKPLAQHYAHMVVHGTLHLLGYDHIDDDEAEVMEQMERDILADLGIPDPYQTS
ncbi:rRNA maturation RNase YbeY [Vreelandella massiliensis]|uniref:rRNA maturation RNase YbeY n=1 Tax=Vreelandella massiliensis TaxID=1816686 RepID=UPI00096AAA08|nr:rRNA maturation RNase YbeY [Halomonas massiliensis]MYL23819.1 rRNA maturation RNase YbeY [Halomonas alkaliantarctica]